MNSQELRTLQEAYISVYADLDEGQTPKATAAYGALANRRSATPASEYPKRGAKKIAVDSAVRHMSRSQNPDAGDRSKKSTKPDWNSGKRRGMTQSDRDHARGEAEYGHTGYDPDWNGPASGPGGMPKGKKAERQKKTGVSAESFDLYDIILSHLLDEGYAETPEAAEAIMVNMSEDWRESIVEEVLDEGEKPFPYEKVKEKQVALRDKGSAGLDRRMKMGMAVRRAKEAGKKGGSQQDAGKDWYHGK